MAEKKATIVIKKITVVSGGGHGGAWKVAFADFMTAMMCFFLVMWLVSSSSESDKKAVSDYFSTPSVIEYNFQNYGVEMTLEKLFLDLINEPLKTLESVMKPMDKNPDVMQMGMKKVAVAFLADQLGEVAKDVQVTQDKISFEIPDTVLFQKGTAEPNAQFITIMDKIKGITTGLENTDVIVTSLVYQTTVANSDMNTAKNVSVERLDIISKKVESSFDSETNDVIGRAIVRKDSAGAKTATGKAGEASGVVRFEMKQKDTVIDGRKPRPFKEEVFGKAGPDHSVYDNFVNQLSAKKKSTPHAQ